MEVQDILNQLRGFVAQQDQRCRGLGIDVSDYAMSHAAVRCRTWEEYVETRDGLERIAIANLENVWNGRPISKVVLAQPVDVGAGRHISVIELIPPFHQRIYKMGLEHVGYVVGDSFGDFAQTHFDVLTGQQFQSEYCKPVYVLFSDYTHVKFYERSLRDACVLEGADFSRTVHAHWEPANPQAGPYALVEALQ
jgi:predicted metalloenzyme YecM